MARSHTRPQKLLTMAVLITIVLALLPARWLRWTADVAAIVSFPLTPFQDLGVRAAGWMRPPVRAVPSESEQQLADERDRFARLYRAEQLRVEELELQLEQLQRIPSERRAGITGVLGRIVERHPRSPDGSARINRGSNHGVEPGTVAVYGGVHLIGRIIDVNAYWSRLEPLTNVELIDARLVARDALEMRMEDAPAVQLRTQRNGTFIADNLAHDVPVGEGDLAVLHDRSWPATAQGMIVGVVESIERNDRDPLRKIVTIRPRHPLSALPLVTLYIEQPEESTTASGHSRAAVDHRGRTP